MHDRSGKAGSANGLALFRGRIACTLALSLSFSIVFASSLSIAASEIYENSTPSSPSITPMTSLLDGQAASSTSADDHGITPITALETMSSDTPSPKTTADGAKPTTPAHPLPAQSNTKTSNHPASGHTASASTTVKPRNTSAAASHKTEIKQAEATPQHPLVSDPEKTIGWTVLGKSKPEAPAGEAINLRSQGQNDQAVKSAQEKAPAADTVKQLVPTTNQEMNKAQRTSDTTGPLIDTSIKPTVTDTLKSQADAKKRADEEQRAKADAQALALKAAKEAKKAAKLAAKRERMRQAIQPAEQKPIVVAPQTLPAEQSNAITAFDSEVTVDASAPPSTNLLSTSEEIPTLRRPTPEPVRATDTQKKTALDEQALGQGNPSPAMAAKKMKNHASADPGNAKPVDAKPVDPQKKWEALGNLLNPFYDEKAVKPIAYSPLPSIVVFPVVKHGTEKLFGDLPVMMAREYASRLELQVPETKVYNPVYTVDELRMRGLGHVYDKIMAYYVKAGRPEPTAMDYLVKQLASDGKTISRIVFVEADLDTGSPDAPHGVLQHVEALMTDGTPQQMQYSIRGRLQIFDAETPSFPMVWAGSLERSIKANRFYNVTPSVYAESDSQQAFAKVTRQMSREMIYVMPKEAYMIPVYDTSVQGQLAEPNAMSHTEPTFPNFTETKAPRRMISEENKKAIQRILQRQNAINP